MKNRKRRKKRVSSLQERNFGRNFRYLFKELGFSTYSFRKSCKEDADFIAHHDIIRRLLDGEDFLPTMDYMLACSKLFEEPLSTLMNIEIEKRLKLL